MSLHPFAKRQEAFRAVLAFSFRLWLRQPWVVFAILLVAFLATMANLFIPVFAGKLVDATMHPGADALNNALWATALMIAMGGIIIVCRYLSLFFITQLSLMSMQIAAASAFARLQRFSTDWHANNFSGSTVRKITRGMWALDVLGDTILISLFPSLVVLLGSTFLFAWRWPIMGVVVLVCALTYISMTIMLALRYVAPAARLANFWDTVLGGVLADAISCNAVVKAFGAEKREEDRLSIVLEKWRKRTRRPWIRSANAASCQIFILLLIQIVVLGLVVWFWSNGQASAGDIAFVLTSYAIVQGYLRDVSMHVHALQRSVNEMEALVEMHLTPLEVVDPPNAPPIVVKHGAIAFKNVTFHYAGHNSPLYNRLSLSIAAGEKIGLVGRSGSGKTTFVKLIQRLYDISAGEITIDGININSVTQSSLRSNIAIVQQEPILFHRSLADNIAYGSPAASWEEIIQAAKLANAHDFISRLPKGYFTTVGERGAKLSGGERQRIALARAFLADAPILILDEATSSLDAESEVFVQEAMERLMQGRTTIVIAHRLSTVRAMDRILVFEKGSIIEEGSHRVLLSYSQGAYRSLFEKQFDERGSYI